MVYNNYDDDGDDGKYDNTDGDDNDDDCVNEDVKSNCANIQV
jgi:hypothetical protein